MNRIELKKHTENCINIISNLKEEESNEVISILNECLDNLLNIDNPNFRNDIDSKNFLKSRILIHNDFLITIKNIENNNMSFFKNNFFQAKVSLGLIIDCLNINAE